MTQALVIKAAFRHRDAGGQGTVPGRADLILAADPGTGPEPPSSRTDPQSPGTRIGEKNGIPVDAVPAGQARPDRARPTAKSDRGNATPLGGDDEKSARPAQGRGTLH